MKKQRRATFWTLIFVIAFSLLFIIAVLYAQTYSRKNIESLRTANQNANTAFDINNRLQELLYHIETAEIYARNKYKGKKNDEKDLSVTVEIIDKHIQNLEILSKTSKRTNGLTSLVSIVHNKIDHLNNFIHNANNKEIGQIDAKKLDELLAVSLNDSLYQKAIVIQQALEGDLKNTFTETATYSNKVLKLNGVLSILVILSIAILVTLIIRRLLEQLSLIYQLGKEKDRADKSASIKEQFLANMSHEIRTPINAVVGFTNLLQKTTLDDNQKQFVTLIQNSGENLLAVVNDILDISKIEAGMLRITKNPFKINETCHAIEMMFASKITEKSLQFKFEYDKNIPTTILGDGDRLTQVLINLLNNAIKFTAKGTVTLSVKMLSNIGKVATIQFAISDTGIGIPSEKIKTVFERFEQADDETAKNYGGTGLGLAIVKQIVSLQNGEIKIESEVGVGSSFIFNIPYEYIKEIADSNTNELDLTSLKKEFSAFRALVAEDNKTNQTLLKYILEQWDLQYDLAENGEQAIDLLKKNKYDIVLMDVQMPVMDGYTATEKIRQALQMKLPIIAMTAHVLDSEKQHCLEAGMNDYISKPINEKEFLELLGKYLKVEIKENNAKLESEHEKPELSNIYIDIDYLNRIFNNNDNFIKEVMCQFREQYPQELKELNNNFIAKDKKMVLSNTHHMKTTVTTLSFNTPLKTYLDNIDEEVKNNNWEVAQKEMIHLLAEEKALMNEVNFILTK
jgi:signal transduction histidine kinase/AmiR/NasT family two-component response regulator